MNSISVYVDLAASPTMPSTAPRTSVNTMYASRRLVNDSSYEPASIRAAASATSPVARLSLCLSTAR